MTTAFVVPKLNGMPLHRACSVYQLVADGDVPVAKRLLAERVLGVAGAPGDIRIRWFKWLTPAEAEAADPDTLQYEASRVSGVFDDREPDVINLEVGLSEDELPEVLAHELEHRVQADGGDFERLGNGECERLAARAGEQFLVKWRQLESKERQVVSSPERQRYRDWRDITFDFVGDGVVKATLGRWSRYGRTMEDAARKVREAMGGSRT